MISAMETHDMWIRICFWGDICSVRDGYPRFRDTQLGARNEIGVLCKERKKMFCLESLRGEIRSDTYLVSSFDLNTIPSLEQDETTVILIQFRSYLPMNRGFVLVITGYPEIVRGHRSLSNVGHNNLEIVLDRGDG